MVESQGGTNYGGSYGSSYGTQPTATEYPADEVQGSEYGSGYGGSALGESATAQSTGSEERLQEAASGLADQARETAETRVGEQVNAATEQLDRVAQAVRQTGDELREQEQPQIAEWADRAAEQVERVSAQLRGKSLGELAGDFESLARREPALFLAGAFTLGLLVARFVKSAPRSTGSDGLTARDRYAGTDATYAATVYER